MRSLLRNGVVLLMIAVILGYLLSLVEALYLVFSMPEELRFQTLYELIKLSVIFLLIFSGIIYIYNYFRGEGSLTPVYIFSILLGILTAGFREIFGILLILAPILAMIRVGKSEIDNLLRYVALSLGVLGYANVTTQMHRLITPFDTMWLVFLGVAILFLGFLHFTSQYMGGELTLVVQIIRGMLAAATTAFLSLNILNVNFIGELLHVLTSIVYALYGLSGLFLTPPLVFYIFKLLAEVRERILIVKRTPPETLRELEVRPYTPSNEEDDRTRIRE